MDTHRRLYHARINSRLTLEQIGLRTALSPTVLRHIDQGKFELLPSGLYARSYIRSFASVVGLDPEVTLAELEHLLPGAPDPLPALSAARPDPAEWASLLVRRVLNAVARLFMGCVARTRTVLGAIRKRWSSARAGTERWTAPRLAMVGQIRSRTSLGEVSRLVQPLVRLSSNSIQAVTERVRALSTNDWSLRLIERRALVKENLNTRRLRPESLRGIVLPSIERFQSSPRLTRCSAAVIDAALLLVVDSFLVFLVSWSSGIPVNRLLTEAAWALAALCAIPLALYFVLFGGIAGSTLGGYVCSLITLSDRHSAGTARPDHPLTLHEILRRAVKQ